MLLPTEWAGHVVNFGTDSKMFLFPGDITKYCRICPTTSVFLASRSPCLNTVMVREINNKYYTWDLHCAIRVDVLIVSDRSLAWVPSKIEGM